ncbi:MAG: hypothetical protein JKX97_03580 [Candidatus Lindowbacteria bacterium]|nr:hypothetical protein [Candidatus Lindowbacteria bacterium]
MTRKVFDPLNLPDHPLFTTHQVAQHLGTAISTINTWSIVVAFQVFEHPEAIEESGAMISFSSYNPMTMEFRRLNRVTFCSLILTIQLPTQFRTR